MRFLTTVLTSEDGATAVEYAVMVALIVVAIGGSIGRLATNTGELYNRNSNALNSVGF